MLVLSANDKASVGFNHSHAGSSPGTEKALTASACFETPALSFRRRSKDFVELQVVQSTSISCSSQHFEFSLADATGQ